MIQDQVIAAIRTICAVLGSTIVVALFSMLSGSDVVPDEELSAAVALVLFALVVGGWNFLVNLFSLKWPWMGYLLGIKKVPLYTDPSLEDRHPVVREDAGDVPFTSPDPAYSREDYS